MRVKQRNEINSSKPVSEGFLRHICHVPAANDDKFYLKRILIGLFQTRTEALPPLEAKTSFAFSRRVALTGGVRFAEMTKAIGLMICMMDFFGQNDNELMADKSKKLLPSEAAMK